MLRFASPHKRNSTGIQISPALDGLVGQDSARRRPADSQVGGSVAEVDGDEVVAHVHGEHADVNRRPDPELAVVVSAEALRRRFKFKR